MTGTVRELAVNAAADTANAQLSPASLIFSCQSCPLSETSKKETERKMDRHEAARQFKSLTALHMFSATKTVHACGESILLCGQDENILHEVLQGCLCGHGVIHEGCLQRIVLIIANDTGWQRVVAHQVCDGTPCKHSHSFILSCRRSSDHSCFYSFLPAFTHLLMHLFIHS